MSFSFSSRTALVLGLEGELASSPGRIGPVLDEEASWLLAAAEKSNDAAIAERACNAERLFFSIAIPLPVTFRRARERGVPCDSMLYSPDESAMSSVTEFLNDNAMGTVLRLLIVLVVAVLASRVIRQLCSRLVRPASGSSKGEQAREQQTRALAELAFKCSGAVVWLVAALTALALLGINPLPAIAVVVVAGIAAALGAQTMLRDLLAGFQIVLEDQFAAGETVQIGENSGRVEQLTLRRTVLRDGRGALVSIANGDIRTVANLSRDWSQAFVDVELAPEMAMEKPLAALESAAAELRGDAAWSQALVDGPRVLGLHVYGRDANVVRLQMKTLPMRQEEIARELRRRIQLEFQKQGIPSAGMQRLEISNTQAAGEEAKPAAVSRLS